MLIHFLDTMERRILCAILVLHGILALSAIGNPYIHHQDESFYFASTRTMLESGDWLIPHYDGDPRINKPILFYWLLLPAQWVGGTGAFTARFSTVGASLALLITTYAFARLYFRRPAQRLLTVWILASCDIFFRYAHYAVPEMSLTLCMTVAHLCFFHTLRVLDEGDHDSPRFRTPLLLFYAAMGAGFMIKGPVAILLPLLANAVYLAVNRRLSDLAHFASPLGVLILLAIISPWYLMLPLAIGWTPFWEMISEETVARVAAATNPFYYYIPVLLMYYQPWILFALAGGVVAWRRLSSLERRATLREYPFVWFAVYFLFYSLAVGEKHQWYALQWAVPLAILITPSVSLERDSRMAAYMYPFLGFISLAAAALTLSLFALFGEIIAHGAAVWLYVSILTAAGVVLITLSMLRLRPTILLAALGFSFLLHQYTVFQAIFPTSGLRAAPTFAAVLAEEPRPYDLLINERYFDKKLELFDLNRIGEKMEERDAEMFHVLLADLTPEYAICSRGVYEDLAPSIRIRYEVVTRGYLKAERTERSRWALLVEFWRSGDAGYVLDEFLLLRRRQ